MTEVSPGVWRLRYWATGTDGYRRRSKTIRNATRKDAERVRAELMLEHSEDAPCPTVQALWDSYALPDCEQRVADGDLAADTLVQYRRWWAKHVAPRWADVPCDQVRPLAVQQWLYGLTRSQAANAVLVLTKAMDYAVRYEHVAHNPMREKYLMPGKSTVQGRDKGIWSLSELRDAWARLHGSWMEPAFLLAAFGSCRVGEALGVRARDVERVDAGGVPVALVDVSAQVTHHGGRVTERMKTESSGRTVVLVGKPAERLCDLAEPLPPDWFLTHDGAGGVTPQGRYYDNWRRLGMGHPFRNLRNAWQTWMRWELRVAPHHIEVLMGHRVKGVTERYYDRPQAMELASVVADAYRARPYDEGWDFGT